MRFDPKHPFGRVIALLALGALLAGCQSVTQAPLPPDSSRPPQSLAVDPSDGSLLKAAGGVFRSTDQGVSWSALPIAADLSPGAVKQVATTSAATGTLFAAGPGAGVIRSDDDGRTWTSAAGDLPSKDVSAFAVHSFHPGTLYVLIAGSGIYRTDDGGDQWQKMDDGPRTKIGSYGIAVGSG